MLTAMILPANIGGGTVYQAGDVLMVASSTHVWGDEESLHYLFADWDDADLEAQVAGSGDVVLLNPYAQFETTLQGAGSRRSPRTKMTRICADAQSVNLESIDQALLANVGTASVKLGVGDYAKGEPADAGTPDSAWSRVVGVFRSLFGY